MRFFRGQNGEENSGDATDRRLVFEDVTDQRLAYRPLPQDEGSVTELDNSCWSECYQTFSFSDVVCVVCLGLVGIFGAAGLFLGFAIVEYLTEYIKTLSSGEMALFSLLPPFGGMLMCMALAFYIWARSIDWAERHSARSILNSCQVFFSSSNPCLVGVRSNLWSSASSAQLTELVEAGRVITPTEPTTMTV